MQTLGSILKRAQTRKGLAGSYSAELAEALKGYQRQQLFVFIAVELLLIIAIAFCAYWLSRGSSNGGTVKALAGLIGLGAGGGLEAVRRVWTQWSQTTLLLILIPQSSPAQLSSIVETLAKRLK